MTEWEDPRPRGDNRASIAWAEFAADLRANPGKWGVRRDQSGGITTRAHKNELAAFRPAEHYEFTTRTPEGKSPRDTGQRVDFYARYIGPNGEYR